MARTGKYEVSSGLSANGSIREERSETSDDGQDFNFENHHGFHWIVASILIVGEMAGGGLVALPESMVDAGLYAGIALSAVSAIATGYTGMQLGENWLIMQESWGEYRQACRNPYPEMAYRALGAWGRVFMCIIIAIQQFCLSVVFIILASNNISSLVYDLFDFKLQFCFIAAIIALVELPLLMLGSPKDFWQAGLLALVTTTGAIVFIFVGSIHDAPTCIPEVNYPPIVFKNFFLAYGTIMFAYGGHSCFPTFQHDMKKPYEFNKSVILAYVVVFIMYLPVSIYSYIVYGDSLTGGSVIASLQVGWVQTVVSCCITLHAIFAIIILMSPLTLSLEEILHVPNKFGIRRFFLRAVVLLFVLIIALSIPKFGPIVDLIGGSTITLMTMILPGVFWIFLTAAKRKRELKHSEIVGETLRNEWPSVSDVIRFNNPWLLLLNVVIIVIGIIGGVASSYSAVNELVTTEWDLPCYVRLFQGNLTFNSSDGLNNCCGIYKNVTTIDLRPGEKFCVADNF